MGGGAISDDFLTVHLAVIQPATLVPADLYIRTEGDAPFVLYRASETPFTDEARQRLLEHGVGVLYLHKNQEHAYRQYVEENMAAIVRDDLLPPEETCRLVYESSSRVMEDLFEDPRSGKNIRRAHAMVEPMVLSILKDPDALWHITSLAAHDYYTYTHSVNVSLFLIATGREILGIDAMSQLEEFGLGGLLHDVGKSLIPEEILRKKGSLTEGELKLVREHPVAGLRILRRDRRLAPTSRAIIRSHHESYDGTGYPDGIRGGAISQVARLAKIIDVYDAVTTERPYAAARNPFDALELMGRMTGHFDVGMLQLFVRFLGPKKRGQR